MNPFAEMGMQALDKTVSNGIDLAFTPAFQKMQNKQTVFNNNLQMNNNARSSSMMVGAMRAAGLNPALAGGEATFQGGAPSESLPTMSQAMSSAAEKMQAISLDLDLQGKQEANKKAKEEARRAKAEADLAETNARREADYDEKVARYFGTFFPNFNNDPNEPLTKGTLDAVFDMSAKGKDFDTHTLNKLENEWNRYYYRTLIDSPELQKKFVDSVKAEFEKKVNENEELKKKLKSMDMDLDIKTIDKRLKQIDLSILEHTNLDAFLSKQDKTWEDYAMFFGYAIFSALANMAR